MIVSYPVSVSVFKECFSSLNMYVNGKQQKKTKNTEPMIVFKEKENGL